MESMEITSTPMTNNVSVPISSLPREEGIKNVDTEVASVESAFSTEDTVSAEYISDEDHVADNLLQSAKEDGFERALERFADGEFSEEKGEAEEALLFDEVEEISTENPDENLDNEILPFHEKVVQLEAKVEELQEENKQILERAKKAEESNQVNQEIMLLLSKALYEIAKSEEDEEKKVNMLELIVKMLTLFLQETMTDYSGTDKKTDSKPAHNTQAKKSKNENIDKLFEQMQQRMQGSQQNNNDMLGAHSKAA